MSEENLELRRLLSEFKQVHLYPYWSAWEDEATAKRIVKDTAEHYGLDAGVIYGRSKGSAALTARWAAIKAVRLALPHWTLTRLGKFFKKDHTTIMYALRQMGVH